MYNLSFISHFYAVVMSQTHRKSQAHSHCDVTPVLCIQHPIVEETLTSEEYISVFLISILNIYIYMKFEYLHHNRRNFKRKTH